jgi:hypothetical protein
MTKSEVLKDWQWVTDDGTDSNFWNEFNQTVRHRWQLITFDFKWLSKICSLLWFLQLLFLLIQLLVQAVSYSCRSCCHSTLVYTVNNKIFLIKNELFFMFNFWHLVTIHMDSIWIRLNSFGQTEYQSYLDPAVELLSLRTCLYCQFIYRYDFIVFLKGGWVNDPHVCQYPQES